MPCQQVNPMTPKIFELTALLKNVPIDWFEPAYWKLKLTVYKKLNYIADGVCVTLPIEQLCEKWEDMSNGRVYCRATSWSNLVIMS